MCCIATRHCININLWAADLSGPEITLAEWADLENHHARIQPGAFR